MLSIFENSYLNNIMYFELIILFLLILIDN